MAKTTQAFKYAAPSRILNGLDNSQLSFATNLLREAAFFRGEVAEPRRLRDGLAALYAVVVSDFKYRPKDRLEYRAWLEEQDRKFLQGLAMKSAQAQQRMEKLEARLSELDAAQRQRLKPYYAARRKYFDYVFQCEYELSYLLDPVITVHPDEVFFEAFSRDESSYARLGVPYTQFKSVDAFECGTTNIDFSARLHDELDRMRSYRRTRLDIEPSGFTVASEGSEAHKEKKIDLPESWVQGFLQVHSVMAMGLTRLALQPIDIFNICRQLRRRRAKVSPRALRYELIPGQRARAVLEPWEQVIELTATWAGDKPKTVRTWGRDRVQSLERLLPVARSVDLYLAGDGLPSIYCLDLGGPVFTLALSGWTDNDWTGGGSRFSLLTRQAEVSAEQLLSVYEVLKRRRRGGEGAIAAEVGVDKQTARAALSHLCQIGRAMYDLHNEVFRHRDLFPTAFTASEAKAAVKPKAAASSPQEKRGEALYAADAIRIIARRPTKAGFKLSGSCRDGQVLRPQLTVDHDSRIVEAKCSCSYYKQHRLTKGPCEHILALRLAHVSRLEAEKGG